MNNNNWRPSGTGWMDLDLVGQQSGALIAFVPPVSIRTVRCIGFHSQVTNLFVPSIYLLMGAGRLIYLLSWVPALFGPAFGWLYILG
jgi:hypothetical protein